MPKGDLLRLQRQVNDLQGELEQSRLAVPRAQSALREAGKRIENAFSTFRAEAQRELNAHEAEIAGLKEVVLAGEDRVRRTEVRSPVRGTIKTLEDRHDRRRRPARAPTWSRSSRSRTRSWSRPRSGRPTSPSWRRACRRW